MTFADFVGTSESGTGIIGAINAIVIPVILTLAFVAFVWGVVKYFFLNAGDEAKRAEGRQFVLWGIVGLALLFSVWSIVKILLSTLGIPTS